MPTAWATTIASPLSAMSSIASANRSSSADLRTPIAVVRFWAWARVSEFGSTLPRSVNAVT